MKVANLTDSRILIVDDQTDNLRVLATVLGFAGYANVNCLSDSRHILQEFQTFRPDLILLDLHMPHVDGLAAMDQLATVIPEDDYLPVLVLTGDGTSEAKEKALSHGAHDYLRSPSTEPRCSSASRIFSKLATCISSSRRRTRLWNSRCGNEPNWLKNSAEPTKNCERLRRT